MIALLLSTGVSLLVAGCGDDKKPADGKAPAAAGDSVGVAECDEYIKKYEGCISKAAGPAKPALEQAFKAQRDGFKQGASTPEGKAALKTQCKTLVDGLASNPNCK